MFANQRSWFFTRMTLVCCILLHAGCGGSSGSDPENQNTETWNSLLGNDIASSNAAERSVSDTEPSRDDYSARQWFLENSGAQTSVGLAQAVTPESSNDASALDASTPLDLLNDTLDVVGIDTGLVDNAFVDNIVEAVNGQNLLFPTTSGSNSSTVDWIGLGFQLLGAGDIETAIDLVASALDLESDQQAAVENTVEQVTEFINDLLPRPEEQVTARVDVDMNAETVWSYQSGSSNIVVAVISSGVDYSHPDLERNLWRNTSELTGAAGIDDDGNGYVDDVYGINALVDPDTKDPAAGDPQDVLGTGTQLAGIIGAQHDGMGVRGVSPNVAILSCKASESVRVLGLAIPGLYAPTRESVLRCMQYIAEMKRRGLNVVATLHGYSGSSYLDAFGLRVQRPNAYRYDHEDLMAALDQQAALNILNIAPAGEGDYGRLSLIGGVGDIETQRSNDDDVLYENASYRQFPASLSHDYMMSVAAIDSGGGLWQRSRVGRYSVDILAGGHEVVSTWPITLDDSGEALVAPRGDLLGFGYVQASGTTLAAAHVAGAVALMANDPRFDDLDALGRKHVMMSSAARHSEFCGIADGVYDCVAAPEWLDSVSVAGVLRLSDEASSAGVFSCDNRNLTRRLMPEQSIFEIDQRSEAQVLTVSVLQVNCGRAFVESVDVIIEKDGVAEPTLPLFDDGENGDARAGDGIYTATWQAQDTGSYTLNVANETVRYTVLPNE